ncbi:3-phosphoshikimate 1-carboxyvinyltransferase [Candidatus Tremblaya princeps]|uniref:3-phosphoshikimate 1-carboxyvinyltransferase n=1 Tax=Tremblaya princeps TaxID=189385 RepID=A0A143WN82_TREPR|nr:3-phosphoshikimate 1-carboxyvinyltransferase [Candidatus Tremblaya princeps]
MPLQVRSAHVRIRRHRRGYTHVPTSKSASNREVACAFVSLKATQLSGRTLHSDDTAVLLNAARSFGILAEQHGRSLRLGPDKCRLGLLVAELYVGNSGTTARLVCACACRKPRHALVHGDPRMHRRPALALTVGLASLGAKVVHLARQGSMPTAIGPTCNLKNFAPPMLPMSESSQFVTAAVLASHGLAHKDAPIACGRLTSSRMYVASTVDIMGLFGMCAEGHAWKRYAHVPAAMDCEYPGVTDTDMTSASYPTALGSMGMGMWRMLCGSDHASQSDATMADAMYSMGCAMWQCREGNAMWRAARHSPTPRLLCCSAPDGAMTALTVSLALAGASDAVGVLSWRYKETDRVLAMALELRRMGVAADCGMGCMACLSCALPWHGRADVSTYRDHRIAMCCSLMHAAGCVVRTSGPQCVCKTYPDYLHECAGA